jgi:hypothetical protein
MKITVFFSSICSFSITVSEHVPTHTSRITASVLHVSLAHSNAISQSLVGTLHVTLNPVIFQSLIKTFSIVSAFFCTEDIEGKKLPLIDFIALCKEPCG